MTAGPRRRKRRGGSGRDQPKIVIAKDCSRIPLEPDDEEWLRRLVANTSAPELLLPLGHYSESADDPIASFDGASGSWFAGRYIGEIHFEGRTLRIEPRFGMQSLMRWLGAIWGVRLTYSTGELARDRIWLWAIIAHLWSGRLIIAAKHGLPFRRINTVHHGRALRGRLLPRETSLLRVVNRDHLASVSPARVIDPVIGPILVAAHRQLCVALGSGSRNESWLTERGRSLISDLNAACERDMRGRATDVSREKIRYSPITESYRPLVELSLSILQRRPRIPVSGGDGRAYGVLLDMAEIWELYVAKLLQIGLPELQVKHTGRTKERAWWLLQSSGGSDQFGSLRPDILITDQSNRYVAIADAKYKTTRANAYNRTGVVTEDLYQLSAYLSGFGEPRARLDGFLIYPSDPDGQIARRLSPGNPWRMNAALGRRLWFLSAENSSEVDVAELSQSERRLTESVRAAIRGT